MLIREPNEKKEKTRELKVKIPLGYHVRLHSLKLTTGRAISDVVRDALGHYFASVRDEQDAPGDEDPAPGDVDGDVPPPGGGDRAP